MNSLVRRLVVQPFAVAMLVAAVGCGGKTGTPPTPVSVPPAPTPSPAPPPALTVADVAVSLSNTMNTTFIGAMRAGSPSSTASRWRSTAGVFGWLRMLLPEPLLAQGNPFQAPCPRGGSVVVRYGGARAVEYNLQQVTVTYSRCANATGARGYTFDATVVADGRWSVSAPESPVRLTGSANVDEIPTPIQINCSTSRTNCIGDFGGKPVGPADTSPAPTPGPGPGPSPTPTPTPVPAPTPTPTPVPSPTPTPPSPSPSPSPSPTDCSFLGRSNCGGIQLHIDASSYAQTLGNSSQTFLVFVNGCQVRTTVCFGVGCAGSPQGTRTTGADLNGLGTLSPATLELRTSTSASSTVKSWTVNLNACGQVLKW
jgi:hypothetical protein